MFDVRTLEQPWQVLGFERGAPFVAPWEAFDAYITRAQQCADPLALANADALPGVLSTRKRLDAALHVIGAQQFKASYEARPR